MAKTYLTLQPSEVAVVDAASRIFAAYVSSGRVKDEDVERWMERSIREAIRIALTTEKIIIAENEMDER